MRINGNRERMLLCCAVLLGVVGHSRPCLAQAQSEPGDLYTASFFVSQAQQPNHRLEIGAGATRGEANFGMRHVLVGCHLRRGLPRGWKLGISGAYYWSRATTTLSATVFDSAGLYSASGFEDTGYLSDPFQYNTRALLAHDRYVPIQIAASIGKLFRLDARHTLLLEPSAGILPIASYRIGALGVWDPRDTAYSLAQASFDNVGFLNPYASISVRGTRKVTKRSSVFFGIEFLCSLRTFYFRDLDVFESAASTRYVSDYRHLIWLAASIGYEVNWGRPKTTHNKHDLDERMPYWPGGL